MIPVPKLAYVSRDNALFTFFSKSGIWCHIAEEAILQLLPEGFGKYNKVAPTEEERDFSSSRRHKLNWFKKQRWKERN